ncbi:porin [Breoghania sp.]|uniref:porin n=1 Tax=Breoghania sp. TaxID=2065378 RepID=UPI00262C45E5|nr:porin [Breoghania sp.]MDJ0932254.1 porin [Breoghania sp.]
MRNTNLHGSGATATVDFYGGHKLPDLVAKLRVDQGWGSAQLMGTLHQNYGNSSIPDSEIGWDVGAGVTFNAPMLAPGDTVSFQVAYSKGAMRYVHENAALSDMIPALSSNVNPSNDWGVGGGITHHWTPTLSSAVTGNYSYMESDILGADFEVKQWGAQGNLVWFPVAGFLMGVELEYEGLNWSSNTPFGSEDNMVDVFHAQRTF